MIFTPHNYQGSGINFLLESSEQEGAGLLWDPGLGKTATTLSWIERMRLLGECSRVLVVAPLRVVYSVWPNEVKRWDQFSHLKTSIVHGTPTKRMQALADQADLYLINADGVSWLANHFDKRELPFDTLVVDESSLFKNWGAKRTKALKKIAKQIPKRVLLTGTPTPNNLADIFAQTFILDRGEALGASVTKFRNRYFYRGGFGGYKWKPMEGSQRLVEDKISHLYLRLEAKDHLDLPDLITNDVWVDLPSKARKVYKDIEKEMFAELENESNLLFDNPGSKYNACKQIAGGGVYQPQEKGDKSPRVVTDLHEAKVDAVAEIVGELQGKPAIVAYQYNHDLERLRRKWPTISCINGRTSGAEAEKLVSKWNKGELELLAVQPQSLSHGVNMQSGPGRDLIWFGLSDNLELYLQLNARLYRQGVTGQVRIHRILAERTVDEAVRGRIESKGESQKSLLDALKRYREGAEGM